MYEAIGLLVCMCLMIFFYLKKRNWIIILIIFLFSLIFGVMSLSAVDIPFTPYAQIFFLLFQSIFFTLTSIELWEREK